MQFLSLLLKKYIWQKFAIFSANLGIKHWSSSYAYLLRIYLMPTLNIRWRLRSSTKKVPVFEVFGLICHYFSLWGSFTKSSCLSTELFFNRCKFIEEIVQVFHNSSIFRELTTQMYFCGPELSELFKKMSIAFLLSVLFTYHWYLANSGSRSSNFYTVPSYHQTQNSFMYI